MLQSVGRSLASKKVIAAFANTAVTGPLIPGVTEKNVLTAGVA
jgi:hypothetical protein